MRRECWALFATDAAEGAEEEKARPRPRIVPRKYDPRAVGGVLRQKCAARRSFVSQSSVNSIRVFQVDLIFARLALALTLELILLCLWRNKRISLSGDGLFPGIYFADKCAAGFTKLFRDYYKLWLLNIMPMRSCVFLEHLWFRFM